MSDKALTTTRDGDLFAPSAFEHVQRVAKMFTSSELVPTQFRGATGLANTVIALNMANRLGADPMAVLDEGAKKQLEPEQLKVFAELPKDEKNTTIDQSFVAQAEIGRAHV